MNRTNSRISANNKDVISEIDKRFERHTNILMEKMDSTVQTVTEQHIETVRKIDDLRKDVDILKSDMAIVKPAVERHSKELKEIKSELGAVKSELDTVKIAVIDTSHKVDNLEKKLDENLANHEKRITKLEEKVLV